MTLDMIDRLLLTLGQATESISSVDKKSNCMYPELLHLLKNQSLNISLSRYLCKCSNFFDGSVVEKNMTMKNEFPNFSLTFLTHLVCLRNPILYAYRRLLYVLSRFDVA